MFKIHGDEDGHPYTGITEHFIHFLVAAVIISTVYGFQTSVKIASAMTQIIIAANLLLLRTYLLVLPLFLKSLR